MCESQRAWTPQHGGASWLSFSLTIAGLLGIFAIAGGLVLLQRASKEAPARLLKAAGWVLVAGGVIVGLCTSYLFKYQSRGEFDSAHMGYGSMIRSQGMGPGMMGPMGPGSMPGGMMPPAEQPGDAR
jgi:hypothetical protein